MKGTTVAILVIGAVGVSALAVMAFRKPPSRAASQNPAGNASPPGWEGLIAPVAGLVSQGIKTFGGSASPKPTTPGQLSGQSYWDAGTGVNLPVVNSDPNNFVYQ